MTEDGEDGGRDGTDERYVVEGDPPSTMSRRTFVKAGAAVAGAAWVGAFGGSVVRSLTTGGDSSTGPSSKAFVYHVPQGENPWYSDLDGREVLATEFPVGESAKVYVGGQKAILMRFEERQLVDRSGTDMGFVAYSSTCTHLGCQVYFAVGQTPAGDFPDGVIYCPCHQGAFDPFRNAKVVYGPPPLPLPKIPLHVIDGRLEAV
ncbi:MAG: Rieske (2Fe-2S) protein [Thermoplasmata archaeon]|nr:MAG: Rieske (2Fe-2S) protein [Thermoplasmata archaeon]